MNHQDTTNAKDANEPPKYLDELAHQVIGAAIEVHRHLGPGFLESVYEDALMLELSFRGIRVARQVRIPVLYKGHHLAEAQLDILVEDELVLELKAVERIAPVHVAQLISYLQAASLQLGLLLNFNVSTLKQGIRRVIWNP